MSNEQQTSFFEPGGSGEALWRDRVAERVAAHRARRSQTAEEPEPTTTERRHHAQQLSQRALENVRRRVEERIAREDAERREREEIERFFSQQQRTVITDAERKPAAPEPTNLIEFPRQHVSGPTAATAAAAAVEHPAPDQLTIFEDAEPQVESSPILGDDDLRFSAIRLDDVLLHSDGMEDAADEAFAFDLPLQVAPVSLRVRAALIDSAIVSVAVAMFSAIFYATARSMPSGKSSALILCLTLGLIWSMYQLLFLIYSGTTPGMNAAHLGISDFHDNVPAARTRAARAVSLALVCLSCGLGFLWALLDEDHLGWHDRMTQTYPRQLA